MNDKKEMLLLADRITAQGLRVYMANSDMHGIFTSPHDGYPVVSFEYGLTGYMFTGNYATSKPRETGAGCIRYR